MKNFKKILSMCLALLMVLCALPVTAFATELDETVIDMDRDCSLTIFKYDITNAEKDGVWDEDSFTSTGLSESYVESILGGRVPKSLTGKSSTLGNGDTSYGYAIKGVEFSYLKVADIVMLRESNLPQEMDLDDEPDKTLSYNTAQLLYGFDKNKTAGLLEAIGLEDGEGSFEAPNAYSNLDTENNWYYTSDVLSKALSDALEANATTVKNELEAYMTAQGATAMALTNESGRTYAEGLPVGLYLIVETLVPEMVTCTVNPFFVSLPMMTIQGDENSDHNDEAQRWNYDVTVYPKNETGIPTLEKTVREAKVDGGKNNGSSLITDGFEHNATGSAGDLMEYQIISTLPSITSKATSLSVYNFFDTLSTGLTYSRNDVKIEIFTDKDCTAGKKVATWTQNDETAKFVVSYSADGRMMSVSLTEAALDEINGVDAANANGVQYAGYSNYTMRVTYTAQINSDASFTYGDDGNENTVVLIWSRTSSNYYDTLIDDCHVYSYGIDLTKKFSDKESDVAADAGLFDGVKFRVVNTTDGSWLTAVLDENEGVYYVNGHTDNRADATIFTPVACGDEFGKVVILGCEDDEYQISEIETASGYTLLAEPVLVKITAYNNSLGACDVYSKDVKGLIQNDPRYAYDGNLDLELANIPQKQLAHNKLTAYASVNESQVNMNEYDGSSNAIAPLTVVNSRGFDLPNSGDIGTWMYGAFGIGIMAVAACVIFFIIRKKDENEDKQSV